MVISKHVNSIIIALILFMGCGEKKSEYEKMSLDEQYSYQKLVLGKAAYFGDEVEEKKVEGLKYSLDEGVPINIRNKYGYSLAHLAMITHSPRTVLFLLEQGIDINIKDKDSATVLHYATAAGYPSVVKALIERGADVNAKALHGLTPALYAAGVWTYTHQDSLKLIWQYLVEGGVDPNSIDSEGNNILLRAVIQCELNPKIEIPQFRNTKEISSHSGYYRIRGDEDNYNWSTVTYILKPLLQKGADPLLKNKSGLNAKEHVKNLYLKERDEAGKDRTVVYDKDPDRLYKSYSAYKLLNGK